MKPFRFVDLFCGGGGSITGTIEALKTACVKYDGRGFNHWPVAIKTIQLNHPEIIPDFARACTTIEAVTPDEIFDTDSQSIDAIWASPSCTHHSVAKGGKPRSNQLREQPEYILPFIRLTKCRRLYVENVKELQKWGPILDKGIRYKGKYYPAGTPDPRRVSKFFNLWLREIKESGYKVDMQVMNAADYGAATARERLIIQAVRKSSGERIVWPEPTHSREPSLFNCKPWRSASEIIDWSIPGQSIFTRKTPLCENTIKRIEAGIKKYWGEWAEPFLIVLRGTKDKQIESSALPVSVPVPTITAGGEHIALISPLFIPQHGGGAVKPTSSPLSTIATTGSIGVVSPFIMDYHGTGQTTPINEAIPTICCKDKFALVQGQIIQLPDGRQYQIDITHRMLTQKELAAATGFPDGYVFAGNDTEAKKQIGNAVCPDIAKALYLAFLAA